METTLAIIDSNPQTARGLRFLVEDMGFAAIVAADGPGLLAQAPRAGDIAVIIADQRAGKDGNGLVEAMAVRQASGRVLPVIILAAKLKSAPVHGTLPSRVDIVFVPLEADKLRDAIRAQLV